jgi:hypothetical protein
LGGFGAGAVHRDGRRHIARSRRLAQARGTQPRRCSGRAARLIPQWEIIDYAHDDKIDAPSGTARELAARLAKLRHPEPTNPLDRTVGPREARGATLSGTQVHSLRLPGYVISAEVIFGMPDQRLTIRHDSGGAPCPTSTARCSPFARCRS